MKNVEKITVDGISSDYFSTSSEQQFYLEVLINKLCTYNGHITFYNDNKAEKYPLKIQILEPKV